MDELNPHGKKRLFYGFPPYSTVRCGAVFFIFFRHSYGAVRLVLLLTVRCGADHFFLESSVLCGAVLLEAKSYGTVRCSLFQNYTVRCDADFLLSGAVRCGYPLNSCSLRCG